MTIIYNQQKINDGEGTMLRMFNSLKSIVSNSIRRNQTDYLPAKDEEEGKIDVEEQEILIPDEKLLKKNDLEAQQLLIPEEELLKIAESKKITITTKQLMKNYLSFIYAPENRRTINIAMGLTAIGTTVNYFAPYLLGKLTESLTQEKDHPGSHLWQLSSVLLLYLLVQIIPNMRDQILIPVASRNTERLLTWITEHQLNQTLEYNIETPHGDQIYLIQKGFSVANLGTPLLIRVVPAFLDIFIAIIALSKQYHWGMGLGVSVLFGIYTTYCKLTTPSIIETKEAMIKSGPKTWNAITEPTTRYKTIHDFNKIESTMKKVKEIMEEDSDIEVKAAVTPVKINYGHILIPRVGMALTLFILRKQLSIAEFIALFGYLNQLCSTIPEVGKALNDIFASIPDLKFVFNELAKPSEIVDKYPDNKLEIKTGPHIKIENLHFNYSQKYTIFNGLSLTILPGQTVALVSESGGGKSTIFNLLYGYYAATSGNIYINNQNISEVSRTSLQESIGLVGQSPNLFKGTIRENIAFGAKDSDSVTDVMIFELAKQLNLAGFICSLGKSNDITEAHFTKGLDVDVGENGKALSGGQQQKVAILRGFLKDTPIRLLDEVTASLDAESASSVLQGISTLTKNKTTIIITHHLSEITSVDNIFVLEKGCKIAEGKHNELLQSCELYRNLWSKQNISEEEKKNTPQPSVKNFGVFQSKKHTTSTIFQRPRSMSYGN